MTFEEWYKTLGTYGKNKNPFDDWFIAMKEAYRVGFNEGKKEWFKPMSKEDFDSDKYA